MTLHGSLVVEGRAAALFAKCFEFHGRLAADGHGSCAGAAIGFVAGLAAARDRDISAGIELNVIAVYDCMSVLAVSCAKPANCA